VAQVADALGVCRATIYKLCERGELAHVRLSNSIRFEPGQVEAFVAAARRRASLPAS
jgi:excisionase family DNA binding protein